MDPTGFEPVASAFPVKLQGQRSPTELWALISNSCECFKYFSSAMLADFLVLAHGFILSKRHLGAIQQKKFRR